MGNVKARRRRNRRRREREEAAAASPGSLLTQNDAGTKKDLPVKVAIPSLIIEDENMSANTMADMLFAEIGGQEILSRSRHDLIDSPLVSSRAFADGGSLFKRTGYIDPKNSIVDTFSQYKLNINDYIPDSIPEVVAETPTDSSDIVNLANNIYTTYDGALYIALKNLKPKQRIEVEFISTPDIAMVQYN